MGKEPAKILLIDHDPKDADLLNQTVSRLGHAFAVERLDRLQPGLERLMKGGVDVVLADTILPDSASFETIEKIRTQAPEVPLIVLTDRDDEPFGLEALRRGAQDYLVKRDLDSEEVVRAIRFAIVRHHMLAELRALSTIDDLTGLYNRRGFLSLTQREMKVAERTKREMVLLLMDLDQFKSINDRLGHLEGDSALIEMGKVLRETFRASDIVGRIGGDEFAVLAAEAHEANIELLTHRLEERLESWNKQAAKKYHLSASVGTANFTPGNGLSLERLLAEADRKLYAQKELRAPKSSIR